MRTVTEKITQTKEREIWDKAKKASVEINYLRLKMINDLKYVIRGVDMYNNLHIYYMVKRWMYHKNIDGQLLSETLVCLQQMNMYFNEKKCE